MGKITVVGSTNIDLVVKTKRFAETGETVIGETFAIYHGGKGANQAVGISRLGAQVNFISKIGLDDFGRQAVENLLRQGLKTDHLIYDDKNPTGTAMIEVDEEGNNRIVVVPGANANLSVDDIKNKQHIIESSDIVLLQMEIPVETVGYVLEVAKSSGAITILNPAPAIDFPDAYFHNISMITPNITEAIKLAKTDQTEASQLARAIKDKGVPTVIITRGEKGAYFLSDDGHGQVDAWTVKAVDTTAAGDGFNAGLAVALSKDFEIIDALRFASAVGALSTTKMGAQSALPSYIEVKKFMNVIE